MIHLSSIAKSTLHLGFLSRILSGECTPFCFEKKTTHFLVCQQHASSESSSASSDELEVPQQNWQPQGDMNPSRIRKLPSLNSLAAVSLFNGEGDIEVQPTTPADEVNFEMSPKLK
eukprot:TRINITY_DN2774_c0_g1_i1.p1 TRINITY_DN2774_c0_g1~~TRINITY_DN2774_c0_g1_i1.p1  ORF type:complete len:116 (-),score=24.24 TRINITY_DN2774_c0_g1_i1:335-682(-)